MRGEVGRVRLPADIVASPVEARDEVGHHLVLRAMQQAGGGDKFRVNWRM